MADKNEMLPGGELDRLDKQGKWQYPSAAASGHVEIVLPSLPGSPNAEERMLAKDFGATVGGHIKNAMNPSLGYLRSGPQANGPEVLAHYIASARGASLLNAGAVKSGEKLVEEFAAAEDQADYFKMVVKPWLHGLTPTRRQP